MVRLLPTANLEVHKSHLPFSKSMVEVKNSAQNERYVSAIFDNEEKIDRKSIRYNRNSFS
jgi:hypothetical protein